MRTSSSAAEPCSPPPPCGAGSLSGFLLGLCAASAAQASTCQPGYYDPANGSACVPAPLGHYVPAAGATAAVMAPPGTYVATTAATAPTPAPPGTYIETSGAIAAIPAPPGTFVSAAGATAPTLAPPGTYVNAPGATAPTPAPPGSYVNAAGATAPNLAPPGSYVAASGATAATLAPLGSYVAGTGATAPTAAKAGFYTANPGAAAPIGAGMVASAANVAISGTRALLSAEPAFAAGGALGVAALAASGSFDQEGLSGATDQELRASGLVLHGQAAAHRIFAGVARQRVRAGAAGNAEGETWLAGWNARLSTLLGGTLFAARSRTDITREVNELATPERQASRAIVQVFGVQLAGAVPLPIPVGATQLVATGGVSRYRQQAFTETAVSAGTQAGLQVAGWTHTAVPVTLGLRHEWRFVQLHWGMRADLNGGSELKASLSNGQAYTFGVPVGQASTRAGFARLALKGEVAPGWTLHGTLAAEAGSGSSERRAALTLGTRW